MTDSITALLTDIQDTVPLSTGLAKRLNDILEREAAMEQTFAHCSRVVLMKAFRPGDVVFIEMDRPVNDAELQRIRGMVKHYEEANLGVRMCVMNPGMKVVGREEEDLQSAKQGLTFEVRFDQIDVERLSDCTSKCYIEGSFFDNHSAVPLIAQPDMSIRLSMRAEGAKWLEQMFAEKKIARINITMQAPYESTNA